MGCDGGVRPRSAMQQIPMGRSMGDLDAVASAASTRPQRLDVKLLTQCSGGALPWLAMSCHALYALHALHALHHFGRNLRTDMSGVKLRNSQAGLSRSPISSISSISSVSPPLKVGSNPSLLLGAALQNPSPAALIYLCNGAHRPDIPA
jgi:hypothetical protein